jgi:chromosome segregation ATPase
VLNKLQSELAVATEQKEAASQRAIAAETKIVELTSNVDELTKAQTELEVTASKYQQDAAALTADVSQLQEKLSAVQSENRKLTGKVERVEKEKHVLILDQVNRAKDLDTLRRTYEALQLSMEEAKAQTDHEKMSKERLLETNGIIEAELDRLRVDHRELQEVSHLSEHV